MIKWLTVLVAIFLIGGELPVAHGQEANKRMENREEVRWISERREQQRITEFKKTIEARKLRISDKHGPAKILSDAAVAVCDRAAFEAAHSNFKKYYERDYAWAESREEFHVRQAETFKKRLAAVKKEISRLNKKYDEAYTVYGRDEIGGLLETQIRNSTDLWYKIKAYAEIEYRADQYGTYVQKLYNSIHYRFDPGCTKETLSHVSKDDGKQDQEEGKHAAVDDKEMRKEDTRKDKTKPEETRTARRQERGLTPRPRAGDDRIMEAGKGGMLTGKSLKLSDLEGCGTLFLRPTNDKLMGWVSTPCPGLSGGRVATQADFLAYCNSFEDFSGPCGPPGPGTERALPLSGVRGMPFHAFCLALHYKVLAAGVDQSHRATVQGDLESVFKYDNNSRKLECFYISKAQAKSLFLQNKKLKEGPGPAKPVAKAEPKKDCKLGGGLVGAMNCVTKRIEGAGGSPTDKEERKSPASASSTDKKTGITTTSVKNPDGTRTVTRTDKNGKILSEETVGKSSASASSTKKNTGEKTTSVGNPDGSRTVTKTDKDGNILSREKVR